MKIKEKMKVLVAGLMVVATGVVGILAPTNASAVKVRCPNGTEVDGDFSKCSETGAGETRSVMNSVQLAVNVVLGVLALITVVMIILGGISYSTSQGDPGKVKKAKDTILYGIIGLVIALLAFAIVNFVLANLFK